jgi:hypothetical protein
MSEIVKYSAQLTIHENDKSSYSRRRPRRQLTRTAVLGRTVRRITVCGLFKWSTAPAQNRTSGQDHFASGARCENARPSKDGEYFFRYKSFPTRHGVTVPAGVVEAERDQMMHALLAHVAERHGRAGGVEHPLRRAG